MTTCTNPPLPIDESTLADFCHRHRIRRLSLFGSRLHGNARADSDVDLLVDFEAGATPGLLAFAGMEDELSQLMGGVPVDLLTALDLGRQFRDEVVSTAQVRYAA